MATFATCRVCKQQDSDQRLVKYGVRHYAHPSCAMEKWGAAFFDRLTPWQAANKFPYFVAKRFGHEAALIKRTEAA